MSGAENEPEVPLEVREERDQPESSYWPEVPPYHTKMIEHLCDLTSHHQRSQWQPEELERYPYAHLRDLHAALHLTGQT